MVGGRQKERKLDGFTITEIIIVITVIVILASISVVGYGAWRESTIATQLKSDLNGVASAMEDYRNFNNIYPSTVPNTIKASTNVTFSGGGSGDGSYYCVEASSSEKPLLIYHNDSRTGDGPTQGSCE